MTTQQVEPLPIETSSPLFRLIITDDGGATGRRVEIMCPKCGEWAPHLGYKNLEMCETYGDHLQDIIKCLSCKHAFSPVWPEEI